MPVARFRDAFPDDQAMTGTDPLRIGLVQDADPLRDALQQCLEAEGLRVDALACAEVGALAGLAPDAVLLADPRDAPALLAAMRGIAALRGTPVIALAADATPGARHALVAAGADDVLPEEASTADLVGTLGARVARARLARADGPRPPSASPRRAGMLRRGEFLEDMGRALLGDGPWRVLMAVRLDQVRELGDALGQAAAYALEQQVAQRLAAELGPGDAQTLWMAFGFGVLCERDSAEAIEALATRLCAAVAASPVMLEGVAHPVTASVGMALAPAGSDAGAVDRWFASAHAAQSIAQRLGGNRIDGVLSREHGGMAPERVLIIREWVKEAASGDNVQVEFQPAVPLRPGRPGIYCVQALLRDYRAPLAGVPRREYLRLARDAGALPMIDRMGLFAAFEAIEAERAQGRATQLLAPVDLASVDAAQLRWLDAELRRRRAYSDALVIELDADVALGRPDLARSFQALEEAGVRIAIADASGDLQRIARLQRFPAGLLRLPLRAVDAVGPARFLELLAPWRASGRELLLDGVADIGRMRALLDLHVDYVLGDALAASSPRLDYEFGPGSP